MFKLNYARDLFQSFLDIVMVLIAMHVNKKVLKYKLFPTFIQS